MAQKIIIDTDPGIDDAMAIHLAFSHPGLEVVGLTTIFGNVFTKTATRNALALSEMAAYPCAVAHGAEAPLAQALNHPADFVHGGEGFGDIPPIPVNSTPDPRSAAQFICEMAAAHPGEITLCPVGPLTNIALALEQDPELVRNVKGVVIMGGAVTVPGNVSEHAEANIWNDPHAADAVFAADWPITLVGLDVTTVVNCFPEDFESIAEASPTIGGFLNEAVQYYFAFHKKQHDLVGCHMHDPTAVIAITDPDALTTQAMPLRTVTEGPRIGKTETEGAEGRRPVDVCVGVDAERVRTIFLENLRAADARRDARAGE